MMAMAIWVKPLAVPGPTPGPWDASAAFAHSNPAAADTMAKMKRDTRDVAMTISRKLPEDTGDSLRRFCKMSRQSCCAEQNRLARSAFILAACDPTGRAPGPVFRRLGLLTGNRCGRLGVDE